MFQRSGNAPPAYSEPVALISRFVPRGKRVYLIQCEDVARLITEAVFHLTAKLASI